MLLILITNPKNIVDFFPTISPLFCQLLNLRKKLDTSHYFYKEKHTQKYRIDTKWTSCSFYHKNEKENSILIAEINTAL